MNSLICSLRASAIAALSVFGAACGVANSSATVPGTGSGAAVATVPAAADCPPLQPPLTLPAGFCATVFADSIGSTRHMVVAPNGDLFVNLKNAGRNSPVAGISPGQVALRDTNGDGRADIVERFGSAGGTGIALHAGYLYADVRTAIIRYRLAPGQLRPSGGPDTVVADLPGQPGHDARNFVITPAGDLFVNVGSASNVCEVQARAAGSPGHENCPELVTRAGIWRFDANRTGQRYTPGARYATGIRNAVAMTLDPTGRLLYAVPHGRDRLHASWPALFTEQQNAELPAEVLIEVREGDHFGWPFCYYDQFQKRNVLAPEYGGDGRTVGRCTEFKPPLYGFPGHWAPNAVLFYTGSMFPPRYRDGVFVAMHGSWNRAPLPQGGYNVVFLPLRGGQAAGDFELFAEGFAVNVMQPANAPHRPAGLAQGPDGALYVSDDVGGRIWRITYTASR